MIDTLTNLIRLEDDMKITIDHSSSISVSDLELLANMNGDVLVSDRKGGFIIRAPASVTSMVEREPRPQSHSGAMPPGGPEAA